MFAALPFLRKLAIIPVCRTLVVMVLLFTKALERAKVVLYVVLLIIKGTTLVFSAGEPS